MLLLFVVLEVLLWKGDREYLKYNQKENQAFCKKEKQNYYKPAWEAC